MASLPRTADLGALLIGLGVGAALWCAPRPVPVRPDDRSLGAVTPQKASETLADWVHEHKGRVGLSVLPLTSSTPLVELDGAVALNPASNAKLLTMAVALDRLGPERRFTTSLHGRLDGGIATRLVLRGDGDPSLDNAALLRLVEQAKEQGLTALRGPVVVDQSAFEQQFTPPAFERQPDEWSVFRAPISAVAFNRNVISLVVTPKADGDALVSVSPVGAATVQGQVQSITGRVQQPLALRAEARSGEVTFTLAGQVLAKSPVVTLARRAQDPRRLAGFALVGALKAYGIEFKGAVELGTTEELPTLAVVRSAPLGVLVAALGKESDNFSAEMLLRSLGAKPGVAATSEEGARVALEWLTGLGPLEPGTRVRNGSGLFDANRLSARALVRILVAARRSPKIGPEFVSALAVGGADGTLQSRFPSERDSRRIRAKTGTLARVVSLAGYVEGPQPCAFAIVVEGIADHHAVRSRLDAFARTLLN